MNIPIEKLRDQFRAKHILVIGDVMLDEYLWGAVVCDICGADPLESATVSNYAAGQVCGMSGVVPIKIEDLSNINNDQDD